MPGFLVNRVLTPYMFAAMERWKQGENKEKIDEAARTFGMPMGPIELATPSVSTSARTSPRFSAIRAKARRLDRLVASGKLGKKTGEGFYIWKDGKPEKSDRHFDKARHSSGSAASWSSR